ncbi:MAG: cytochrome d ubiquinol oxidase subunit II [Dehalococcoidia bacterium]|nr:cytochrome d ubiquinol oxidase subunit II [Dehalococcoidia bacterium]
MSPEEGAAAIAVAAIVLYAVFGGADFGGGIWTLFATGPRKEDQRNALERAIGPVWETNHVWLILLVVTLFVVFPTAYAIIFTALYVPLFLSLLGIVARGAAFALRHYSDRDTQLNAAAMRAFSVASLLTPFMFGATVGALTGGHIDLDGTDVTSGAFDGWLTPFALVCGLIGLLISAFVAAAFMVPRTEGALQRDFRRRALVSSVALGAVTTVAIPLANADADLFFERLDRWEVVLTMAVTALLGLATLALLARGFAQAVPLFAGATVAGVITAWALALNPNMVLPGLTIEDAATANITVVSFLIALPIGALILVPSLYLLYNTFSRDIFVAGQEPPGHP